MGTLNSEIVDLLIFLLPGFVAAAVFHSLTPFPRREPFERTVQALIFTILVQAAVVIVRSSLVFTGRHVLVLGSWSENVALVWSVVIAVVLGLWSAYVSNRDLIHGFLRKWGVTLEASFASEWYGALSREPSFVVLNLVGKRRLYGWPERWPSSPEKGHFVIIQAEWLPGSDEDEPVNVVLPPDNKVLVPASEVEMVELIPADSKVEENQDNG